MPVKSLKGGIGVRPLGFGLGAAEEETEPNFNQTVLLLHADGSEGAGDTSNLGDTSTLLDPSVVEEIIKGAQ